ncbi:hypothetical protein [Erythrobacter sp. F6033]|uniref:hypothetical protein n=1 Tax=Erythrobacter sp. F6033 TaxID=2926401 RepID=UPI001FF320C4|nr:hypothetical protein [Erythrobacter sp. F6033]MCK0129593.1 hypothetical protein [Erythrobacter sp. F6033]
MRNIRQRIANFRTSSEDDEGTLVADEATKKARVKKPSIATLRGFVPLIGAWGALLGALCVLVLPMSTILRMAMATGLSGLGSAVGYVFALIAALVFGGLAAAAAIAFKRREVGVEEDDWNDSTMVEGLEPIDPAAELGSESLDAPIEIEPFSAAEVAIEEEPFDLENEALVLDVEQVSEAVPEEDGFDRPRELNLAEFAATPGRNAVWIENEIGEDDIDEDDRLPEVDDWGDARVESGVDSGADAPVDASVDAPIEEPVARVPLAAQIAPSAQTALEKLRQAPVEELSLVHMVERFAAALHDHQDAERKRPGSQRSPGQDASLAAALKALTLFTEEGFDAEVELSGEKADALRDTTRELRDALAKLQDLRGAA